MIIALLTAGSLVFLVSGLGILKLPDLFMRLAAISKAGTLGLLLFTLAALIHATHLLVALKLLLGCVIFFVGSPTAAHLIGRAGYRSGAKPFKNMRIDEWKGK